MADKVTRERVLAELVSIGFADVTDFLVIKDGQLQVLSTDAFPKGSTGAVCAVERGTGGIKLKFYDKLRALELLGKYLGLFDGSGQENTQEGILEAVVALLGKEVDCDDLPELQQAADPGNELVEPPGTSGI